MPAVAKHAVVSEADKAINYAITVMNPISLNWGLDKFAPKIAAACEAADKK